MKLSLFVFALLYTTFVLNSYSENLEAGCDSISKIKTMTFKNGEIEDQAYKNLIKKGSMIVPCLIDKMSDTEKMQDPRKAPPYPGFVIGDAAFFIISDILDISIEELLPEKVKDAYKSEGAYAYFEYVEKNSNRRKLMDILRRKIDFDYGNRPRSPDRPLGLHQPAAK